MQVWIDLHTHGREWRKKKQINPKEFERCNVMRRRNLNPKSKATLCQSHFSIEKMNFDRWHFGLLHVACNSKCNYFMGTVFVCVRFFSFKNPIFKLITVICACFMLNDNERKKRNNLCSLHFFRTPIRQIGRTYEPIL